MSYSTGRLPVTSATSRQMKSMLLEGRRYRQHEYPIHFVCWYATLFPFVLTLLIPHSYAHEFVFHQLIWRWMLIPDLLHLLYKSRVDVVNAERDEFVGAQVPIAFLRQFI